MLEVCWLAGGRVGRWASKKMVGAGGKAEREIDKFHACACTWRGESRRGEAMRANGRCSKGSSRWSQPEVQQASMLRRFRAVPLPRLTGLAQGQRKTYSARDNYTRRRLNVRKQNWHPPGQPKIRLSNSVASKL